MAKVYAELIRKGLKTIDKVPEPLREDVRQRLTEMGYPELANPMGDSEKETLV